MDQATTRGLLHFHLTMFEDDESSTSAMRSDVLVVRVRAFKSTPRSAWKMGLDLRYVDRGIKIFQFYFRSSLQMEWLPSFCFICGVLGFGGFFGLGLKICPIGGRGFLRNIVLLAKASRRKKEERKIPVLRFRWLLVR